MMRQKTRLTHTNWVNEATLVISRPGKGTQKQLQENKSLYTEDGMSIATLLYIIIIIVIIIRRLREF